MRIALASDHAGFAYKEIIKQHLTEVRDFGTDSPERCDYPDFIRPAAEAVASGDCERCVVLGGSGNGEAIAANKVPGIRCALVWSEDTARWSRGHNDANGISFGARTIGRTEVLRLLDIWLATPFDGGRHAPRVAKIEG